LKNHFDASSGFSMILSRQQATFLTSCGDENQNPTWGRT
jgi:hypothetical protein